MKYKEILRRYSEGPNHLRSYLKNVPHGSVDFKPTPDSWSIRNVFAHLLDCEVNSFIRIRKAIAEPNSKIMSFDQDAWANNFHYDKMDVFTCMNVIQELRDITMLTLNQLFDDTWLHHMHHPEEGQMTIYDWIQHDIEHLNVHIKQMNRNIYDWNKEQKSKVGAKELE